MFKNNCGIVLAVAFPICYGTKQNVKHMRKVTDEEFGPDNAEYAESVCKVGSHGLACGLTTSAPA